MTILAGLRRSGVRSEPLTWRRVADGVLVVCSLGHNSRLQHQVDASGNIFAPPGISPSLHCGTCNELFNIVRLDDWAGRRDAATESDQ